jgi:hypothetical protein
LEQSYGCCHSRQRPARYAAHSGFRGESLRARPTMTAATLTATAREANIGKRRCRSICSSPIRGVSTRCTATWGTGSRIAGMKATRVPLRTAPPGHQEIVVNVSFAAVPGAAIREASARPSATGSSPPELLRRLSCREDAYPLNLYLFTTWSRAKPWSIFLLAMAPTTDNSKSTDVGFRRAAADPVNIQANTTERSPGRGFMSGRR